ncbi:hypothetical protein STANM309S_06098 [Streptomyces tanashiensis]
MRTGAEPRYPSQWSRVSSTRSEEPSTRYMMFSGPVPIPSPAFSLTRSCSQTMNAFASSVKPRPSKAYTENEASRIQVNR